MKRITLLLMALGLGAPVGFAQGNRIVCDETCRIEYQKTETAAILSVKPAATGNAEDDIEAKINADFEKSEKILSLRREYYQKFRTFLSPPQIQAMYDIEKEFNARR